jgi:hypothetical protein
MAHRGLNLLLAVGLLFTSTPRAMCLCSHSASAAPRAKVRSCPFCGGQATPQHQPGKPCQCGACEVIQAVPPGGAVDVPAPVHASALVDLALDAPATAAAACHVPEKGWAAQPPGSPQGAGRALTIFLGHLLF